MGLTFRVRQNLVQLLARHKRIDDDELLLQLDCAVVPTGRAACTNVRKHGLIVIVSHTAVNLSCTTLLPISQTKATLHFLFQTWPDLKSGTLKQAGQLKNRLTGFKAGQPEVEDWPAFKPIKKTY